MACEKARRSWRVWIVTSVTDKLPPTPSMRSLHKPRPVFPPHMASIEGYCCRCCCACSSEKKTAAAAARHSTTKLIMKSVTSKQMELALSPSRWAEEEMAELIFWKVFVSLCTSFKGRVCALMYPRRCVRLCANRPAFKVSLQRQQGKLFTTWLVIKCKYASVGALSKAPSFGSWLRWLWMCAVIASVQTEILCGGERLRWKSWGKPCCPVRSKILQLIWGEAAGTQSAGKPSEKREGPCGCTHGHTHMCTTNYCGITPECICRGKHTTRTHACSHSHTDSIKRQQN